MSARTPARSKLGLALVVTSRAVACVIVLAIGFGIYAALVATRPRPAASEHTNELRRIVVTEALEMPVGRRWKAYGSADAIDSANVPAEVAATITSVSPSYRAGSRVAKGESLLSLDDKDFRQQLSMADEALAANDAQLALLEIDAKTAESSAALAEQEAAFAKADVERAEAAKRDGAALDREVDRLRTTALLAERIVLTARETRDKIPARRLALKAERSRQQSARDMAKTNLERCDVRSPLDGVLQSAELEIGEMVHPGMRVARVVGIDAIEVPLLLPASARAHLIVGNPVVLRPDRVGSDVVDAKIARIAPEDDPTTRTITVYAEVNASACIAPGSFVEAEVSAAGTEMRTVLPRRAVSGGRVLAIEDGRIRTVPVELEFGITGLVASSGLPDTEWVVLRERLAKGTRVVLDGSRQLAEGVSVEAIPADAPHVRDDAKDVAARGAQAR